MSDLPHLLNLCMAEIASADQRAREADKATNAEAVQWAESQAVRTFGEEAAATLGPWLPLDIMDADCMQASTVIAPGIYLLHTAHIEGGMWFTLLTDCRTCHHHRETRIGSLEALAGALQRAGAWT
ncbi:hypothetical protein [Streptomyces sp. NPDC018693]|uniref:hypothetical protein n=1 Tax=unclassified Streptomyces TaxID=2593676 RepID=UPI0037B1A17F